MLEAMRTKIANEQVLFSDEGIRVIVKRRGTAPGFRGGSTGRFSGAIAITDRRIIASISKTVMVDAPYDAIDAHGAEASIKPDGLHVNIDASIRAGFTGEIEMYFKTDLTQQLNQMPQRELKFNFAPELVPKIFGVPG